MELSYAMISSELCPNHGAGRRTLQDLSPISSNATPQSAHAFVGLPLTFPPYRHLMNSLPRLSLPQCAMIGCCAACSSQPLCSIVNLSVFSPRCVEPS